jgi:hypothetical protein
MTTITYAAPTPSARAAHVARSANALFDVYAVGECLYRDVWDEDDGTVVVGRWKSGEHEEVVARGLTFDEVARFLRVNPEPTGKRDEHFSWWPDFRVAAAGADRRWWRLDPRDRMDTRMFVEPDPEALPYEEFTYLEGWYRPRKGIA